MQISVLQPNPTSGNVAQALERIDVALGNAVEQGAQMLVAPELMLPGYHCPDAHRVMAQQKSGDWLSSLGQLTRRHGCALTFGWAERGAGGVIYNAASVLDATGLIIAHHRKCILYGDMEKSVFERGPGDPCVFDFCGHRIGILICYEIEFPETARALSKQGVDTILVPTANPAGFDEVQDILIPARACENSLSVVYANFCGTERGLTYGGRSIVVGPDGQTIAQADQSPTMFTVTIPHRKNGDVPPQIQDYAQAYGRV